MLIVCAFPAAVVSLVLACAGSSACVLAWQPPAAWPQACFAAGTSFGFVGVEAVLVFPELAATSCQTVAETPSSFLPS